MALSRAAAAAARKAARNRGLQGNRAEDGSMLTATERLTSQELKDNPTLNKEWSRKSRTYSAEEINYEIKLEKYSPDELVDEINRLESMLANAEDELTAVKLERQLDIAEAALDDALLLEMHPYVNPLDLPKE